MPSLSDRALWSHGGPNKGKALPSRRQSQEEKLGRKAWFRTLKDRGTSHGQAGGPWDHWAQTQASACGQRAVKSRGRPSGSELGHLATDPELSASDPTALYTPRQQQGR